jgi:mono/diheme cytochrome c family protein
MRILLLLSAVMLTAPAVAVAQTSNENRGRDLLERLCSNCHGVGLNDKSRHSSAPPFRQLMKRYKAEVLAEALAEGLSTGHPDMPEFTFQPEQIKVIIEYLDRLSKEHP